MEHIEEEFDHKGLRVRIIRDEDPAFDPEEGDTPIYLAHFHRDLDVCNKALPFSNAEGFREFMRPRPVRKDYDDYYLYFNDDQEDEANEYRDRRFEEDAAMWDEEHAEWAVFMVSSYIHSGIVLALAGSMEDARFPDRQWDVSHCGAILVKKDGEWGSEADDEGYSYTRSGDPIEGEDGELVATASETVKVPWREVAESHVKAWNQYLSGDIWGYTVERAWNCSECGSHGHTELDSCWGFYGKEDCIEEAKSAAESHAE